MIQPGGSSKPWPFSSEVLAERLVAGGYLPGQVVERLVAEANASRSSLVTRILESHQMTAEALRDAMSHVFGLPVANLGSVRIDPTLIANFPSELARSHMLLPLHREGDRLVMVVADPTHAETIRLVRRVMGLTIDLRLAALDDLAPVVHTYFSPRLVILLPSGETRDLIIPAGELKIGRADHNDIVLPDPTVGSTHAVLRAHGDEYQIVDFGSRNGVFVDGKRIDQSHVLGNGDVIQIGQCLLTFKLPLPEAVHSSDGATQILTPEQVGLPSARVIPAPTPAAGGIQFATTGGAVAIEDDKKKKKKKAKKGGDDAKLKSAWISFIGRILAQIVGAIATIILGLAVAGKLPTSCNTQGSEVGLNVPPEGTELVKAVPFGVETNGEPVNASGIVAVDDSKFLLVDNNVSDSIYELDVDRNGAMAGALVKRPLPGISAKDVDDLEALAVADAPSGNRVIVATTSLYKKESKKAGEFGDRPSGLLRIAVQSDGSLRADLFPNFKQWFVDNVREVKNQDMYEPDEGGLNVEGIAWDAGSSSLLFGLRTPLSGSNRPLVVPVKVANIEGPWEASNFQARPAIELQIENVGDRQGIRSIDHDPESGKFLVVVGNATSVSTAPFQVYSWDGNEAGKVTRFKNLWFDKGFKPEGLTRATIGGKSALVVADDDGGYAVLWDDDPRLAL